MSEPTRLAKLAICVLQSHIANYGYMPRVHFELQHGYKKHPPHKAIDIDAVNLALKQHQQLSSSNTNWLNQWKYVSDFTAVILLLPQRLKQSAYAIYEKTNGFNDAINRSLSQVKTYNPQFHDAPNHLGNALQQAVMAQYNRKLCTI